MLTRDQIHHNANRHRLYRGNSKQTGVVWGTTFNEAFVLVLMLGAGCIVGGWPELGLTICSIGIMALFVGWLMKRGHLAVGLPLVTFLLGYFLCWCVGFLGYCYVLPWRGFSADIIGQHFVVTATLVLLGVCSTCLGGWAAVHLVRPVRNSPLFRGFPGQQLRPQLVVFGAGLLIYQILWFSIIGLNARWELGNHLTVGSKAYWVSGFAIPMQVFFGLLGLSLKRPLWSASNLWAGAIVLASIGLFGLTGGRGSAFGPFILFGAGALFSPVGWRAMARLYALALPMFIALMLIIGWVRDSSAFAGGSIKDKITAIGEVVRKDPADTSVYQDPYYVLFTRLFEPSGQVVIDDNTDSNRSWGWSNFDRLMFLFVPQFAYPAKLPVSDSAERLISLHGVYFDDFTATPLPFLADAYERFGTIGVIGFHFAAGMILVLVGRLVLAARWQLLGVLLLVDFAKAAQFLYDSSVLEFIVAVFYGFLRDTVVIASLFAVDGICRGGDQPPKTRSVLPSSAARRTNLSKL
jgi:hypothetical protein